MSDILEIDGITVLPEYNAIFAPDRSDIFSDAESASAMGQNIIANWGEDNDLPAQVMKKIGDSEIVGANLDHNIRMAYGQGVKPMLRIVQDNQVFYKDCDDEKVLSFFEDNDVAGYFIEQCTDMCAFYNVWPEVVLTKDLSEVISLRHKEAVFSRWGITNKVNGKIITHGYSSKWGDGANENNTTFTQVLDRYNPFADLTGRIESRKVKVGDARFIIPVSFPTPGKLYYQEPPFWSIFKSGSYDYSMMLWNFKKLLLKQGLAVRYIVYISDKYWDQIYQDERIERSNLELVKARKEKEKQRFRDFLSKPENSGKGIMALKKMVPSGSSMVEEKYIVIEEIKSSVKGGEFLEDSSEVANYMSYAMGVFSNLVANSPGKTSGNLNGSDAREKYMIKSAMMAPVRDRLLKPLYFVKKFNKWPSNLVFTVPDYEFTTLDQNKSGKQLITQSNAG